MSIQNITTDEFEAEVLKASDPVLVDFWAAWCGPCKRMLPVLEELNGNEIRVVKVNSDDEYELASKYGIRSIPTMMLFSNGEPVGTMVGVKPKSAISEWIEGTI